MKRTLHFKNPCLTQEEYDFILKTLVEVSSEDFDETTWQGKNEYYFLTENLEVVIRLDILEELLKEFLAVILTEDFIYVKNMGGKL